MNTAQRLGFNADEKLLIMNADDFGLCHATNEGIFQLLEEGAVSSATVMMPCAWAKEAVSWSVNHPRHDVGVHFTLTNEWDLYKWGPVNRKGDVSSLITSEGFFPQDIASVERAADPEAVQQELIVQIEIAKLMGLDPTHLDNHMGSVYGLVTGRHFLREIFEVCAAYGLPFRIPRHAPARRVTTPKMQQMLQQLSRFADAAGVVILDYLHELPYALQPNETYDTYKSEMIVMLRDMQPGVNELVLHPSLATDELKAFNPHWIKRRWDMDLLRDEEIRNVMAEAGIRLIRWSDLRNVQRAKRP